MGMHGWQIVREFIDVLSIEGQLSTLYRGQPNASWDLTPSIFRDGSKGIGDEKSLYRWKRLAARFASPLPTDATEWLVLAQHYGLATPLLDWTTSPLVALYFACDDEEQSDERGAVWGIDRSCFEDAHETLTLSLFKDERPKPFLINAVGRNPRSTAQDSIMSLHTIEDYKSLKARQIFEIAAIDKRDTILTLRKLGISTERLHFDIAKLVAWIKKEF